MKTMTLALAALLFTACGHTPAGLLQYRTLQSEAEGRALRYGVYLPPGWDQKTPLPLVVMLHGAGDDETGADREKVVKGFDEAIRKGELPPFVMVAPRGERGLWMNWHDGRHRYKDWVLDEVVPAARAAFPTTDALHLVGVSMGAGGGMQMWLSERERFTSATLLSAPILDEESTRAFLEGWMSARQMNAVFGPVGEGNGVDPYQALKSPADLKDSQLVFGAASHDTGNVLETHEAFHAHLKQHAVPHRFVEFSGWHTWNSWAPMFVYGLCHQLRPDCAMALPDGWQEAKVVAP